MKIQLSDDAILCAEWASEYTMESADLDSEFLTKFSCMGTTDRDVLINDLHSLLGSQLSREGCAFFLDMTNW